jgi:hypothetical protein
MNRKFAIVAILFIAFLGDYANSQEKPAASTIDQNYVKHFSNRNQASLKGSRYWIFDNTELGAIIGCYSWGCKDGSPILGKKVVIIGRFLKSWSAHGGEANIYQLEAESASDTVLKTLQGQPPPLGQASPEVKKSIDLMSKKISCGNGGVTYCTGVFWGTIRYNPKPRYVLRFTKSDYYYIDIEGFNIYSKYGMTDILKDSAKFGVEKGLLMVVDSGFSLD